MATRRRLVIAGHGMVGHRLVELLLDRDFTETWHVMVLAEERRAAYDRVHLSSFFAGAGEADLCLVADGVLATEGLELRLADPVASIDRDAAVVVTATGLRYAYDALVLATGSSPFVPPIDGCRADGCFVYRTLDDLEAIRAYAVGRRTAAVVGGGLLGLEAANALLSLGLETHVVELAPRLMPVQVDDGGGAMLRRLVERLGVAVHTGCQTTGVLTGPDGAACGVGFADETTLAVDMVVFSAGIRPRDDLARTSGLAVGERGGVLVDDHCRTEDPRIFAIGECAHVAGRTWGMVGPGYQMAKVVADQLSGQVGAAFVGADLSTKLKLLGIEVASFGDAFATTPGTENVTYDDPVANVYRRVVVDPAGPRIIGGVLVGDASGYDTLVQMARGDVATPPEAGTLALPATAGGPVEIGPGALSPSAVVCSCNNVTKGEIVAAVATDAACDVAGVKACTLAGTGCGGCVPQLTQLVRDELRAAGVEVGNDLCEHFAFSRQELFDIVRVEGFASFADLLAARGSGLGCEICKPAVASMLASLGGGYILDGEQASLQDTNDHFLANLQRDGTYSVVPRVPGGEITPDQLIAIGAVAKEFGLYTKITGGQRIDLFGARVDQLPAIWARLVDAGMESGHAYGKALRTVKSCVGQTWCRYGVQDSTSMAILLELRYRGLRAPHKIKMAVSGCVRECAEAQSKDVGVIATEHGWNLYVAGNGGAKPQHAALFATDLTDDELVRCIDRFLVFYIRTADRLERTATWFNKLEGGLDYLRRVVIDDVLGIGAELDAAMTRHVDTYECEWKATISSPQRLARFRTFVNTDEPDPNVVFVTERGQPRPARPDEKSVAVGVSR